jgi:hypothetical protein
VKLKTGHAANAIFFNTTLSHKTKYNIFIGTMPRQLHTFTVYYSQNEMTEQITFCVIHDCLKHDAVPAHLFQSKLCSLLSGKLKILPKIYYFSDNTALQYKKGEKFHQLLLSYK